MKEYAPYRCLRIFDLSVADCRSSIQETRHAIAHAQTLYRGGVCRNSLLGRVYDTLLTSQLSREVMTKYYLNNENHVLSTSPTLHRVGNLLNQVGIRFACGGGGGGGGNRRQELVPVKSRYNY